MYNEANDQISVTSPSIVAKSSNHPAVASRGWETSDASRTREDFTL